MCKKLWHLQLENQLNAIKYVKLAWCCFPVSTVLLTMTGYLAQVLVIIGRAAYYNIKAAIYIYSR